MPSDKPFLSFVIEQDLLDKIDNYRFNHRFPSRSSAIRFLVEYALKENPAPKECDSEQK